MSQAVCPNCDVMTSISNSPKIGENVVCNNCGVESIIVWLNPVELDLPYQDNFDEYEEYAGGYDGRADYYGEDSEDYP